MSAALRLPIYEVQEITIEEAQALLESQAKRRFPTEVEAVLPPSQKLSTSPYPQRIAGPFADLTGVG